MKFVDKTLSETEIREMQIVDTTAVLNIRSRLGNDSMEILNAQNREKFVSIVKEYFNKLWR